MTKHYFILNLSLDDQTLFYKSLKWRRPQMEDHLKMLKVEYLSIRFLDHTQISSLILYDQTMFSKSFKWRRPPMEDDIKIFLNLD